MTNNVVGLFESQENARLAIDELTQRGFSRDQISVVAADQEGAFQRHSVDEGGNIAAEGAVTGLTSGAVVGGILGLLLGTGAIFIPGGVFVAGPIAGLLTGAAAGAATGGLLGALIGLGIPKEHAEVMEEGIRRGGVLLVVDSAGRHEEIESLMRRHGAVDIEERMAGASPMDRPYTTEQAMEDAEVRHVPDGRDPATMGGDRMEALNTNTMVPGNPPTGNDGIGRGTMTDSYTGSAGSVGTGSIALPSGAMGTADDDMQTRRDHIDVVGDVPNLPDDQGGSTRGASFDNAYDDDRLRTGSFGTAGAASGMGGSTSDAFRTEDFRTIYDREYSNRGISYEQALPAYEYGRRMGQDPRCQGKDWAMEEQSLRDDWESRSPGSWILYREIVRSGYETAGINTGRARMM